ncbi:MAG TPA: hypothetical protein VK841_26280, partial [Polyangiaceae bacterium]|nr:hypothetical protein [Polyangiaceae bacterium]
VTVALGIATSSGAAAVTTAAVSPSQTQSFYVASLGSTFTGTYTWSVSGTSTTPTVKPTSGITTVYTAGPKAGTDVVTLTDAWGNSATLTVTAGLAISPASATIAPGGTQTFTLTGAATCTWSLTLSGSGTPAISTTSGNSTIYTAGHASGTIDILQCADAAGNTALAKISVSLSLSASTASVTPGGSLTLSINGAPFPGTAYTWALTASGSGAPALSTTQGLTTIYTAGQAPGSDTVTLTDPWGNTASCKVTVGIVITPSPTSVSPGATVAFTLTNGPAAGVTYTWAITTSGSGSPTLSTTTGLGTTYTAGHGTGTDVVKVTDSNGNSGTATITVGVQISPATVTLAAGGTQSFSITGALAGSYTWTTTTNSGSPTLSPATGLTSLFTAGHTGGVTETVTVTDPWGNKATATVTISGLTLTASATTIGPTGTITLKASGGAPSVGSGPYTWSLIATGSNNPSLSAATGPVITYTAGTKDGVDAVKVQDSWGNSATVTITVQLAITLVPSSVSPSGQVTLGSNEGGSLSWTISTNNSGGTIGSMSGVYQAGANGGVSDTVTVTDANGNQATASIPVGESLIITPNNPSVAPGGAIAFTASGGSGAGYTWSVLTNRSGGSIAAGTGAYTAGSTPNQDVIRVTDSYGNTTTTTVTVVCGADASLQILYPYNNTVLPLGLSPPLIQWSDNGTASYAKITIQYPATGTATFTWSEVVPENGALSSPYSSLPTQLPVTAGGRAQIPATVWTAFSNTAAGNNALISVQTLENGSGSVPATITIHFVNAQLTGTIYYQSYGSGMVQNAGAEGTALPNGTGFGGATLAIQVGAATPTVAAGYSTPGTSTAAEAGCRVCHSVASGGSFLITQEGASYPTSDIVSLPADVDTAIASPTNDGRYAWPAISPDGTMLFSNSGTNPGALSGSNGTAQSGLYALPSGSALSTTGIPSGLHAMMPTFANDTSAVAFNYNSYDAKSLALMNVSSAGSTWNFTSPSVLFTPSQGAVVWPSFLPAGQNGIVFEDQIQYNCQEFGATNASAYGADLRHNIGAQGELWWINTNGTPVAARLANANGAGYLPNGPNGHGLASSPPTSTTGGIPTQSQLLAAGADSCRLALGQAIGNGNDAVLNYEPTINPSVTGGYSWVVFTSRRMYGNVATVNPWASDPRYADTSVQPTPKKLWVAAVNANPTPGEDPSYPAFYLPGQELLAGNSRGYWVLPACVPPSSTLTSASACNTTADCCQSTPSTCTLDIPIATNPPTRHCVPNSSSSCSADGAACNTDGDCCNLATEGARCASGICQRPSQLVYTSPRTVSYDFQGTCSSPNLPVWELLESDEEVPNGTSVSFTVQTAQTESALGAAQTASMGSVSMTVAAPQYATSSQTVDAALRALSPTVVSQGWLRVNVTLTPSADQFSTPTLTSLVPTYDCVAGE